MASLIVLIPAACGGGLFSICGAILLHYELYQVAFQSTVAIAALTSAQFLYIYVQSRRRDYSVFSLSSMIAAFLVGSLAGIAAPFALDFANHLVGNVDKAIAFKLKRLFH